VPSLWLEEKISNNNQSGLRHVFDNRPTQSGLVLIFFVFSSDPLTIELILTMV
jgi:hypothetical protein